VDLTEQKSSKQRTWPKYLAIVIVWVGANLVVMWAIEFYESRQLAEEFDVSVQVIQQYDRRTVSLSFDGSDKPLALSYRLRTPPMWAGRHSTPLLVFLHGSGERGSDNAQTLRGPPTFMCGDSSVDTFPCAILVPQCPERLSWSSVVAAKYDMTDVLLQMIDDVLADRRIDPERVYLAGYSMGGFGSWQLAARASERFAAVVPIAGGANTELAKALKNVPIWAVHSSDDNVVSVDGTRKIIEAIREAGGSPKYLELTNAGHGSWKEVFREDSLVLKWMFQQRKQSKKTSAEVF